MDAEQNGLALEHDAELLSHRVHDLAGKLVTKAELERLRANFPA